MYYKAFNNYQKAKEYLITCISMDEETYAIHPVSLIILENPKLTHWIVQTTTPNFLNCMKELNKGKRVTIYHDYLDEGEYLIEQLSEFVPESLIKVVRIGPVKDFYGRKGFYSTTICYDK